MKLSDVSSLQVKNDALQKDILRWIRFKMYYMRSPKFFRYDYRRKNVVFVQDKYTHPFTTSALLLYFVKNRKPKIDSRRRYKLYEIY